MQYIQLIHLSGLGYSSEQCLPKINLAKDDGQIHISFRNSDYSKIEHSENISAASRFLDIAGMSDITFHGIETDSPLAPLIIWDIAHTLEVGRIISFSDEESPCFILKKKYYSDAFIEITNDNEIQQYKKIKKLPIEEDSGLDEWSFCIPVGPEDATLLNIVVKRILELKILNKEIILCGRPAENFLYFDRVRIVGEDITAPPVRICRKKNKLIDEAKYKNLCILHDRVFLPSNFLDAIKKFGDMFSICGFTSFYFADKYNIMPRRYSDFGLTENIYKDIITNTTTSESTLFSKGIFTKIEEFSSACANPNRLDNNCYLTGSLYIAKKSLLKSERFCDRLNWEEFEDIEYAFRCFQEGIPSRIIPDTCTQSLTSRPIINSYGQIKMQSLCGRFFTCRTIFEFLPVPKKPMLKVSIEKFFDSTNKFIGKYIENNNIKPTHNDYSSIKCWVNLFCRLIILSKFRYKREKIEEFVLDVEKMLLFDHSGFIFREYLINKFVKDRKMAKHNLLIAFDKLIMYVFDRAYASDMFYKSLDQFLQKKSLKIIIGTFISSLWLYKHREDFFAGPISLSKIYKILLDTTPIKE